MCEFKWLGFDLIVGVWIENIILCFVGIWGGGVVSLFIVGCGDGDGGCVCGSYVGGGCLCGG